MRLLTRIVSFFDDRQLSPGGSAIDDPAINPAGLPMTGGIDVAGNPFGTNLSSHRHDDWQHDLQFKIVVRRSSHGLARHSLRRHGRWA